MRKIGYTEVEYKEGLLSRGISIINKKFGTHFKKVKISKKTDMVHTHGGANVNDYWGTGTRLLRTLIIHYDMPLIVAPQTFYCTKTNFPEIRKRVKKGNHLFVWRNYLLG